MDISDTLQAKSDQLNSDDLIGGPRTYTVEKVSKGSAEQPVDVHLVENPGHPYRPSKSMRRVLATIWGTESGEWVGRKFTLYRDPTVRFGGDVVGGIKISHASHIDEPKRIPLTVKRGQKAAHTVDPLPDGPPPKDWDAVLATALGLTDVAALGALWTAEQVGSAPEHVKSAINARAAELKAATVEPEGAGA